MRHKDVLTPNIARYLLGGICGVSIGLAGTWGFAAYTSRQNNMPDACAKQYYLTNQSLDCAHFDARVDQLQALDAKLQAATDQYVKDKRATRVSVFVRGLLTRQFADSNENDTFAPASLLKLPLMIAYYKIAQLEPTILDSKLTYTESGTLNDNTQDMVPQNKLAVGQQYTVEQLIEDMIENSDNNSTSVLLSHMDPQIFDNTLIDLGLKIPAGGTEVDFVTAKTYAGIFSQLYNASYLNRDYSQKALELMSKSVFAALSKGLPPGTVVADKFGERQVENPDGTVAKRELHDCGIIYEKGARPYTLCIMTEGPDFTQLESVIKDISKITNDSLN
jgi:beta-lactamase class A